MTSNGRAGLGAFTRVSVLAGKAAGLLALAALLPALPAAAQTKSEPAAKSDDIVVVGRDARERDKQIQAFVRGMTPTSGTDPLARFDLAKLCPKAFGLTPSYDQAITERMRRVAKAAKIDLAPETCRNSNALVIFADDKEATIALLRKRYAWLFRDRHGDTIKVNKEDGPAAAWHVDGMVSRDGVPIHSEGGMVLSTTSAPSRLQAMARPVFLMSVVVIERRGVEGLSTTQIGDYAALRAFSDATPARARKTGAPSILNVLEAPMDSEIPLSMTEWDLSFLRGLYASPPNSFSPAQRGAINSYMRRELEKAAGEKK